MVAELVEAHRVERSEKRKFKILHVTKILNFIFLTHYNKIGISWMKSIYVNERQESVLISTKIVTWMKSIYVNERQGENQMAVFGNVQKLLFAFFPLSSYIISTAKSIFDIAFFRLPLDRTISPPPSGCG